MESGGQRSASAPTIRCSGFSATPTCSPCLTSAGDAWPSTPLTVRRVRSPESCCASTAWIPTVTSNASNGIPVTTRWTYGTFGTARSTPPTSAARYRPNKSPTKKDSTCWPGSAITSRFPRWASSSTPPTFRRTAQLLQGLLRANQRALELLVENRSRAVDYVAGFLDRLTRDEAQQYYRHYVEPYFLPGRVLDLTAAQHAVDTVAAELGVASVAADTIYAPSL